jgi:hypothetical protein
MNVFSFLGQYSFYIFLLWCVAERKTLLSDCTDGNVERLIREENESLNYMEAKIVLTRFSNRRVG